MIPKTIPRARRTQPYSGARLLLSSILCSGLAAPAMAQSLPGMEPDTVTEDRPIVDENGVDLLTGEAQQTAKSVSIGDLTFAEGWVGDLNYSNYNGVLLEGTDRVVIFYDGWSVAFEKDINGNYQPENNDGEQLYRVGTGTNFRYIDRAGNEYEFVEAPDGASMISNQRGNLADFDTAKLKTITRSNGEKLEWHYRSETVETNCDPVPPFFLVPPDCVIEAYDRAQSITSNRGYMLKGEYAANTPGAGFEQLTKVTAIDLSEDYCDPDADSCGSLSITWPSLTIAESVSGGTSSKTITDRLGDQFGALISGRRVDELNLDNSGSAEVGIARFPGGKVQTVTRSGVTYSYAYSSSGGILLVTKTLPNGATEEISISEGLRRLTSFEDAEGNVTTYDYDTQDRLERITLPEGNQIEYDYDTNSRVTSIKRIAKPGSGLATTEEKLGYVTSCVGTPYCNQPLWTEDAAGNRTDYEYNATHNQLVRVRLPAPASGQPRPEFNYSYSELYAKVKNSSGQLVNADSPIWVLTEITTCSSAATCPGSADETVTTITYGTGNGGSNLLPTEVTTAAGDGSVSSTVKYAYDDEDNLISVDGALAGTDDTVYLFYDTKQRLVGQIGPDPDGSGPMLRSAVRTTYNSLDQVTEVESGTATGTSQSSLNSMTLHESIERAFNSNNLLTREELVVGGTTEALTQLNYDSANRVMCRAVRMNKAAYTALPGACTLSPLGTDGFDRITKNHYDMAGRVTRVESAVGTPEVSNEMVATYNNNGTVATLADGEGNLTSYTYDGFDRQTKVNFPHKTTTGTSSSSDFAERTFDTLGRVTQLRRRNAAIIGYEYDDLNRLTKIDPAGTNDDVYYTYDLSGRQLTARLQSASGQGLSNSFDALGRLTSVTDTTGGGSRTTSYQYDAASRRSRMTWHDGFYVTYDYLTDGALSVIRENGSAALATYGYDTRGRRTSVTYGNGTAKSYGYDPVSRLASLSLDLFGTGNDTTTTFLYNPAGQIKEQTRSNDSYAWTGSYNVDRSYTVNGLNQLTGAGALTLTYDGRGNLSSDGTNNYTYDPLNRLTFGPGGVSLSYDPYGRLHKTTGSATIRMGYDGTDLIAEYNNSGILQRRYVHGPGLDDPILWYEGSGTADKRYLHKDERGSVIAVTNSSGGVIGINRYDEYGIPDVGNIGRFQYTGQQYLDDLGLYHYKARTYSPTLGRFLQTDPIGYGDGMNMYAYVRGDPVNFRDPSGLNTSTLKLPRIVVPGPCKTCVTAEALALVGIFNFGGISSILGGGVFGGLGGGGGNGITVLGEKEEGGYDPISSPFFGITVSAQASRSGRYNGPSFCSDPTLGRPLPQHFPRGRITTGKNGGKLQAVEDIETLAALNGVPTMASTNYDSRLHDIGRYSPINISLGNGWSVRRDAFSGYLIYSNSGLTLRTRSTPNSVDVNIDIPEGYNLPNGDTLQITETCHYYP